MHCVLPKIWCLNSLCKWLEIRLSFLITFLLTFSGSSSCTIENVAEVESNHLCDYKCLHCLQLILNVFVYVKYPMWQTATITIMVAIIVCVTCIISHLDLIIMNRLTCGRHLTTIFSVVKIPLDNRIAHSCQRLPYVFNEL